MPDVRQRNNSNILPAVKAVFDQIGAELHSAGRDHSPDEIDEISERLISEALLTRTERREAEELARSINGQVRRRAELRAAYNSDARRKARAQIRKDKRSRKATRSSR